MDGNNVINAKIIRNKQEFRNIKQSADFTTMNLKYYIITLQSIQKIVNTALTEIVDQESKLSGVKEGDELEEDEDQDESNDETINEHSKRGLSPRGSLKKIRSVT